MSSEPNPDQDHGFAVVQEDDAVSAKRLSLVISLALLIAVVAVVLSGWLCAYARRSVRPQRESADEQVEHAPAQIAGIHQTPIGRDRHGWALRERQRAALEQYRWLNRERGIVQIPIERAMLLIARRGRRDGGAP